MIRLRRGVLNARSNHTVNVPWLMCDQWNKRSTAPKFTARCTSVAAARVVITSRPDRANLCFRPADSHTRAPAYTFDIVHKIQVASRDRLQTESPGHLNAVRECGPSPTRRHQLRLVAQVREQISPLWKHTADSPRLAWPRGMSHLRGHVVDLHEALIDHEARRDEAHRRRDVDLLIDEPKQPRASQSRH